MKTSGQNVLLLVLFLQRVHGKREQILVATVDDTFNGRYKTANSVANSTAESVSHCHAQCTAIMTCLSFFYNSVSKRCVMHSNSFALTEPNTLKLEIGWRFYLTKDGTGRCPSDHGFVYYRELDLCYNFNTPVIIDFTAIKVKCAQMNGELVRIVSEERQKYIEHALEKTTTERICIQGTDLLDPGKDWTFDDGTLMTYFNWDDNQPTGSQGYLEMYIDYKWHDIGPTSSSLCIPICERIQ